MGVALDVSKIFKFCFQILKADRVLFRQYPIKFSKFSRPDAVQSAKTVKTNSFSKTARHYVIMTSSKFFFLENVPLRHANLQ